METFIVTMSENNSGGYFTMSESDYAKMYRRGFKNVYYRCVEIRIMASTENRAIDIARMAITEITGKSTHGYNCITCGDNFYFYAKIVAPMVCADCGNIVVARESGYCVKCEAYNS